MDADSYAKLLEAHGVKPTANRIIIARALGAKEGPMSMKDLENAILSLDKSSIFRTLTVFREHHMVHVIEGANGVVRYELCLSHDDEFDDDEHVHFFCERCHRTFCLYDTLLPQVKVPEGYELHGANYMLSGLCPACREKERKCNLVAKCSFMILSR